MKIILTNSYHGTRAAVIAKPAGGYHYVSPRAYRRAIKKLCGVAGCQCGGIRGGKYSLQPVYTYCRAENYCGVTYEGCRV